MTVAVQTPISSYTGNGVTTAFSFGYYVAAAGDLVVMVDGVVKALTTDYTLTGIGSGSGGTCTFVTAPASGADVVLYRDTDLLRETDYQDNGDLLAAILNGDFDRIWLALQETINGAKLSPRAIRAPVGETLNELTDAASRAGKILSFNATTGQPEAVAPTSGTATDLAIQLASTSNGDGASLIGVEDSGGYYPESTVEDVLEGIALRAYCIELEAYRNLVTQVGGEDRWDAAFAAAQTAAIAQKKPIFLGSNPVVKYFTTTWNLTATDTSKDGLTIFGAGIRWSKPYWRNTTGACIEVQGVDRLCLKDFQIAGDGPVGIAGGRQSTRQWNGRQWLQNVMIIMPDNMAYNSGIGSIAYLGIEPEESTYDCCEFWANLPVFIGPPNQINVRTFTIAGALTTTRSMTWTPTYNPIVGTLVSNTVFHFQGGCRMVAWQPDSPPVVLRSASTVDLGNSFLQVRCPNNPAKDVKKCPFAIDASNVWNLKWFGTFERGSNEASPDGLTDVGALLVDGSAENWTVSANAGTAAAAGVTLNLVPCIYAIDATGGQWRHNEIKLRLNGNIAQYPILFSNPTAATTQIQNCSFDIGSTAALSTIPQPFLFNMSGSTIRLLGTNSVSPVVLEKPARYTQKLIVGKELGASAAATTVATIVLPVSGISSGSATFENVTLNAGYLAGSANTALISGGFEVCWTRNAATTGLAVTVTRTDWGTSVKTAAGSLDIAAPTITAVLSGQASFQIQVASNLSGTGTAGVTTRMDADLTVTAAFGVNASTATVTTQ